MATASPPAEPNERECSICHEQFTEPKLLSCGHLLCRGCLLSWLQIQTEAHCPLCRCAIVEPEEQQGKSLEDIADGFLTDFAMAALVESQQLLSKYHVCQACVTQTATSLCLSCGDLLCASCVTIHGRMSSTRHHTVESLTSLTAEKVAANRPSPCAVHVDEITKLFCPTHGVSICLLCASSTHRNCPEVKDLEEKAKETRADLAELVSKLSTGETNLEQTISQLDQQLQDTEKQTQADIAEMKAVCDRLEAAVKECRHRLEEQALSACSDVKEPMHGGKTRLLRRRGKLTSNKQVVQRVQEMVTRDDVSSMTATMKTFVSNLDCSTTLPADAKVISTVRLTIDPEAVSRLEKGLSELGEVKIVPAFGTPPQRRPKLQFHDKHGKNIVLSNGKQTAKRQGRDHEGGIVVCCLPMETHKLYEVHLDKRDQPKGNYMWMGVTTAAPDTLSVPGNARRWSSAVVINKASVDVHGVNTKTEVGSKLKDLPVNSRVGVMVNAKRSLHLYINGQHQGEAAPDIPDPCFAFFDIFGSFRQVTLLPVRTMK